MIRTCNGLELRDQIPPLPPTIALGNFDPNLMLDHHILDSSERNLETISISKCKLHGNSKPSSTTVSPHHHRVQNIDLMDDIPLPFPTENHNNTSPTPNSSTPIFEHKKASTVIGTLKSSSSQTTTPRRQYQTNETNTDNSIGIDDSNISNSTNVITSTGCCAGLNALNGQQIVNNNGTTIKHRWHACPELHKAMDGVTYIADHTKKEEESTRVCLIIINKTKTYLIINFILGERRLEIRSHGIRSIIFMDFYNSCNCRHRRNYITSTNIIRYTCSNRC